MIDEAMAEYRAAIEQGWRNLIEGRRPESAVELADASRVLAAYVEGALTFVHADPARPRFVPWITADRRWADNGRDSTYWYAPLDGRHRYRITGRRNDECYLSATVYAGRPAHPDRVVSNVNHRGRHDYPLRYIVSQRSLRDSEPGAQQAVLRRHALADCRR